MSNKVNKRKRNRDMIVKAKTGKKCIVCDETDSRALDFHHVNTNQKDFTISDARSGNISVSLLRKEINKCVLMCSNCHRKEHQILHDLDIKRGWFARLITYLYLRFA